MGRKQLHAFFSTTFNSSCWLIDIVFTINYICILVDVVIIDPTQTDLLPWSYATQGFVAFYATQAKENNYCNWHPTEQFLLLIIEIYGGLHKDVDVFLHDYANAI